MCRHSCNTRGRDNPKGSDKELTADQEVLRSKQMQVIQTRQKCKIVYFVCGIFLYSLILLQYLQLPSYIYRKQCGQRESGRGGDRESMGMGERKAESERAGEERNEKGKVRVRGVGGSEG